MQMPGYILRLTCAVAALILSVTASKAQPPNYYSPQQLRTGEFRDGQGAGSITPSFMRDLINSVSVNNNYGTPRRTGEGNAMHVPVGATLVPPIPNGATMLYPTMSPSAINTLVTSTGTNGTLFLAPGLYRGVTITPLSGQKIIGAPGAVLDGSVVMAGWGGSAGNYTIALGFTPGTAGSGVCDTDFPTCNTNLDVFYNGVPLQAVQLVGSLVTGTYFYDGTTTLHIFDNPNGTYTCGNNTCNTIVETTGSGNSFAINGTAPNVTVQNIVVAKYAGGGYQNGCFGNGNANGNAGNSNWTVDHVEVMGCHGYGIRMANGWILRSSYVHDNGQIGVGGGGNILNTIMDGNELSFNNYAHFNCGNECGNHKFGQALYSTAIYNNSHDGVSNPASGAGTFGYWYDVDGAAIDFAYNVSHDNGGGGASFEEECYLNIHDNVMWGDGGYGTTSGEWNAEIQAAESHHVVIRHNDLTPAPIAGATGPLGAYTSAGMGILLPQQARSDSNTNCGGTVGNSTHWVSNVDVQYNTIHFAGSGGQGGGAVGMWCDISSGTVQNIWTATPVVWDNNHYTTNTATNTLFRGPVACNVGGANYNFTQWQTAGFDTHGWISTNLPSAPAPR
jgi:hypothetical protein